MSERLGARARRGSLWLGLANLGSKGSQIFVILVLARFLTETDLGLTTIAVAMVNIAQVMQAVGVYEVIARTARDEVVVAGTVLTLSLVVSTVLAIIGITSSSWIADVLGAPGAGPLLAIVAVSLPFSAVGGVQMALMHRSLNFRSRMLPDAGSAAIGAAVTITLAATGAGAYSLVIGLLCAAILQPIFGYLVAYRIRPTWDRGAGAEVIRWIRYVGPAAIVANIILNVDYAVISRVLGPHAVGIYSLAFRIAWVPYMMVAVVLGAVAFPVYTAIVRRQGEDELPSLVGRFTYLVLIIVGGLYVITGLMANRVEVIAERWAASAPVLVMLCVYGLGMSVLITWFEPLQAVGRIRAFLLLEITHLAILAPLLVVVTQYGVVAAAVAQVASVWCVVPIAWWSMVRARVAPSTPYMARSIAGLLVPALATIGLDFMLRHFGIDGQSASLPRALLQGTLLVLCFVVVAAIANRQLLAEVRSHGRGAAT